MNDKQKINILVAELKLVKVCCKEALEGSWDKSDEGFQAMINDIDATLKTVSR